MLPCSLSRTRFCAREEEEEGETLTDDFAFGMTAWRFRGVTILACLRANTSGGHLCMKQQSSFRRTVSGFIPGLGSRLFGTVPFNTGWASLLFCHSHYRPSLQRQSGHYASGSFYEHLYALEDSIERNIGMVAEGACAYIAQLR